MKRTGLSLLPARNIFLPGDLDRLHSHTPLGARFGRPEEVAPVVVFLAFDDAARLTGERISASGGLH